MPVAVAVKGPQRIAFHRISLSVLGSIASFSQYTTAVASLPAHWHWHFSSNFSLTRDLTRQYLFPLYVHAVASSSLFSQESVSCEAPRE